MHDDQNPHAQTPEQAHVGPPDLILQAILPPTDAPAEIRAAVADALARRDPLGGPTYAWEDIGFAASAIALVEGTNQHAEPGTQWVFALSAESPRLGEQVRSSGRWKHTIGAHAVAGGTARTHWRAVLHDSLTTEPRRQPEASGA
jgi:hypothetical protein